MNNRAAMLGIYLVPTPAAPLRVGSLIREVTGTVSFVVDDDYIGMCESRPIVSMAWRGATEEDTLRRLASRHDKVMRLGSLPPFFQNLLPEGALRELVEREFGTGAFDDFDVLARLGEDLPGALVARLEAGEAGLTVPGDGLPKKKKAQVPPGKIKFSLAGVQLKFSVLLDDKGVTVPGRDEHGNIILKVPTERYPGLVEAEFASLMLARAIGVRTADGHLVPVKNVEGIPVEFMKGGDNALAIRRFDRGPGNQRIHTEDFAQIIGAVGDRKYTMANEETNLNMIRRFCGDWSGELLEGVRRIVANLMLGNGDAHLKNWSLLYPPDNPPELTPAYDLGPTFLWGDNNMALAFGGSRDAARITLHKFERAAGLLKVSPKVLADEAKRTVEAILDLWPSMLSDLPVAPPIKDRFLARWEEMALVREIRP